MCIYVNFVTALTVRQVCLDDFYQLPNKLAALLRDYKEIILPCWCFDSTSLLERTRTIGYCDLKSLTMGPQTTFYWTKNTSVSGTTQRNHDENSLVVT